MSGEGGIWVGLEGGKKERSSNLKNSKKKREKSKIVGLHKVF